MEQLVKSFIIAGAAYGMICGIMCGVGIDLHTMANFTPGTFTLVGMLIGPSMGAGAGFFLGRRIQWDFDAPARAKAAAEAKEEAEREAKRQAAAAAKAAKEAEQNS